MTVCCLRNHSSLKKDLPWARCVTIDTLDGALLQGMLGSQDAVLLHRDTVVPSATTIRKLYRSWCKKPQSIHALSGMRWTHGQFRPAVEQRSELVDWTCCMLQRRGLARYFRLISDLCTYHQLGQQQFPEVALSFCFDAPHYIYTRLQESLECHVKEDQESTFAAGLEEVIYDTWVQQCSAWATANPLGPDRA